MAMNFELKIEQTQKVVMTLELQQAINLLQFSTLELSNYIQEEVTQNPLLEIQEKEQSGEDEEKTANGEADSGEDDSLEWEEYFQDLDFSYKRERPERDKDVGFSTPEFYVSQEAGLQEHLEFQLKMSPVKGKQYLIVEYLLGNINSNGICRVMWPNMPSFWGWLKKKFWRCLHLFRALTLRV